MSLFVADTHALAWYFTGAAKLGSEALDVLRASASGRGLIVVPTIVLAELMWISEKKRISLEFHELVDKIEASQNFEVYPFDMEVLRTAERIRSIPELHDRIVVATAVLVGAKILSKDEDLRQSGIVEVVW
ncbi:MAG: type II toxin-antitoxin system VapC family toxin [Chloroflexota bacterium]